ncbi:Ppx/GppA phosphatase family protein [Aliikangiella sp. IMCC44359]|uniref:Ppx/GppA phosphatase family protein n=1 Tax=Aliikangiella sp. IMCC44359 TaxID=3459125 RepID=UPI00403ADC15
MRELYATVDLGSNSFHMLTASVEHDEIKILDSISEKVMLADSLSKKDGIAPQAMQRGLDCIQRFAERIAKIPEKNIRVVGTNTLRSAINANEYVNQLEKILGNIQVDIVSGIEEARLIYLGVNHSWSSSSQLAKTLVIDIGGGSTEFIIGKSFKLKQAYSLKMGCVAYRRFFPNDEINEKFFRQAYEAAKYEIANTLEHCNFHNWEQVVGSAGTFKTIEQVLINNKITDEGITLHGLQTLKKLLLKFKTMEDIKLDGIRPNRLGTILPGIAISLAIFKLFKIKKMSISRGGLREGVLYDLLGRLKKEDIRERSINAISRRYQVSKERSKLLNKVAKILFHNFKSNSLLDSNYCFNLLHWSLQCSRIGLAINHNQYHIHSAYLIQHSELSGFSIKERKIIAAIILNHRRKLKLDAFDNINIDKTSKNKLYQIVFINRIAAIVTQNAKVNQCAKLRLSFKNLTFQLSTTQSWLNKHKLLAHALKVEQKYWDKSKFNFKICITEKITA